MKVNWLRMRSANAELAYCLARKGRVCVPVSLSVPVVSLSLSISIVAPLVLYRCICLYPCRPYQRFFQCICFPSVSSFVSICLSVCLSVYLSVCQSRSVMPGCLFVCPYFLQKRNALNVFMIALIAQTGNWRMFMTKQLKQLFSTLT